MNNLKVRINEKLTDLFPLIRGRKNALVLPTDGRMDNGTSRVKGKRFYLDTGDGETWFGRPKPSVVGATDIQYDEPVRSSEEVLFGGAMKLHFGHFLCESISRLWALDKLGSEIPIVYGCQDRAALDSSKTPRAFFDLVNVRNPVILVDEPTVFAKVWNASCLYHPLLGRPMHPRLRRWIIGRLPRPDEFGWPDLYVSRSGLPDNNGRLLGEAFIEQGLASKGYHIFRPEQHSLRDQVSAYRNSRRIVLSESSSIHLMSIVANSSAKVAMINRRASLLRGIDCAKDSFLSNDVHYIHALQRVWYQERPDDWGSLFGVAEPDLTYLWRFLQANGFIDNTQGLPRPSPADFDAERQEKAADRTICFELEPGQLYQKMAANRRKKREARD